MGSYVSTKTTYTVFSVTQPLGHCIVNEYLLNLGPPFNISEHLHESRECLFKCEDDTFLANPLRFWRSRKNVVIEVKTNRKLGATVWLHHELEQFADILGA